MTNVRSFESSPSQLLRVRNGFRLRRVDTSATPGYKGTKEEGAATLAAYGEKLATLQEKLFAASRFGNSDSLLLVLQGMDTAGKGGIVRHVVGLVDLRASHTTPSNCPPPKSASMISCGALRRKRRPTA